MNITGAAPPSLVGDPSACPQTAAPHAPAAAPHAASDTTRSLPNPPAPQESPTTATPSPADPPATSPTAVRTSATPAETSDRTPTAPTRRWPPYEPARQHRHAPHTPWSHAPTTPHTADAPSTTSPCTSAPTSPAASAATNLHKWDSWARASHDRCLRRPTHRYVPTDPTSAQHQNYPSALPTRNNATSWPVTRPEKRGHQWPANQLRQPAFERHATRQPTRTASHDTPPGLGQTNSDPHQYLPIRDSTRSIAAADRAPANWRISAMSARRRVSSATAACQCTLAT